MKENYDIAVIGGGGAGTMAYLRAVLNNDHAVIFMGDANSKRRGRATWVSEVDNMPGLHDIKNPITSTSNSTLKWLAANEHLKHRGTVIKSAVSRIEKENGLFKLHYTHAKHEEHTYAKYVIIATGIMDVQPHINGEIEPIFPFANRNDVLYCVRCDGHRTLGKRLSIIGHKTPALAIAAMMKERYGHNEVFILTNGQPEEFSEKFVQLSEAYGFTIIREPIVEILGNPKNEGLTGYAFANGEKLETNCTLVSLGIIVYNGLLQQLGADLDGEGRVPVSNTYETSVENLFAVGDIVAGKKMQIYTAWDEAVDAADEINRRIRLEKRKAMTGIV